MHAHRASPLAVACLLSLAALAACDNNDDITTPPPPPPPPPPIAFACDADNGGITVPSDFCAVVYADLTTAGQPAKARHLVVTPSGDVFVAINSPNNEHPAFGIIALRDTDADGKADSTARFSAGLGGSGIAWMNGQLFFGANGRVLRFPLPDGAMMPSGAAEVVVGGLVDTGDHISKTIVLRDAQTLLVNIGSSSNACQQVNREAQSPGVFPCPEMDHRAGVWQFSATGTSQSLASGQRYATGLRNMVALAINPLNNELYGVQHGRDMLFENWPQFFTEEEDARLPAEELVRIAAGSDNGWPYCFFDPAQSRKVLAPEYGGDGQLTSGTGIDCAAMNQPLATFGAHWAPNGMLFYTGTQFPERYRNGLFIAFHGGFDRAPLPNEGFKVMFVPMGATGAPSGAAEVFADGFAGASANLPADAAHRPVGVAQGPDGSLYVSDDRGGRIYRIVHRP